jgi:hypothetical protein
MVGTGPEGPGAVPRLALATSHCDAHFRFSGTVGASMAAQISALFVIHCPSPCTKKRRTIHGQRKKMAVDSIG